MHSLTCARAVKYECPICGYKWSKTDEKLGYRAQIASYCIKCGAKNLGVAKTCKDCGSSLHYKIERE